jgi:hypothetical protein
MRIRKGTGRLQWPLWLERVAFSANCDDVSGHLRILFELLPQPCNVDIHRARSDEWLVMPDSGQ